MAMWLYRGRTFDRALRQRFDALREMPSWASDVRMATMQFIRARDTERLTRKFNDELLPEMLKLRPELEKLQRKPLDPDRGESRVGRTAREERPGRPAQGDAGDTGGGWRRDDGDILAPQDIPLLP